jgi:prevent-host-death family protein
MKKVNTHEAKTQLSRLLRRVASGEEITISNRGVPVARLVPVRPEGGQRVLGDLRGKIWMAQDFDAPLPEELLSAFEGRKKRRSKNPQKSSRSRS